MEDIYYLYQIDDAETGPGFGLGGYVGTTKNLAQRRHQHFDAARRGTHPNPHIQRMYDQSAGGLRMHVVCSGTRDEILAREALVVNQPNKHANRQRGGGPLRGRSKDELIDLALRRETENAGPPLPAVIPPTAYAGLLLAGMAAFVIGGVFYYLYRRWKARKSLPPSHDVPMLRSDARLRLPAPIAPEMLDWTKSEPDPVRHRKGGR